MLATIGGAVGLGNIWRFSYVAGENGGVAFLFIYLTFVFFIGVPLMITEVAVGRGGQGDAISAFETGGNGKASVIHNMAAITVTANAPAIPAP